MIETRMGTKNKAVKIKDLAKVFNGLIKSILSEIKESSTNTCDSKMPVLTFVGKKIRDKKNEKDGEFNKELRNLSSLLEKPTCSGNLRDLISIIWYLKSLFNITKKDIEEAKNKLNSNSELKNLLQRPHLDLRIPIFMSILGDIYEEIWDCIRKNTKQDKGKLRPTSFRSFFYRKRL